MTRSPEAEIKQVHADNYAAFGARKMQVMLNRPQVAERHGAGHVARCTARAPHARNGPTRPSNTSQVTTHHPFRCAGPVPAGSW